MNFIHNKENQQKVINANDSHCRRIWFVLLPLFVEKKNVLKNLLMAFFDQFTWIYFNICMFFVTANVNCFDLSFTNHFAVTFSFIIVVSQNNETNSPHIQMGYFRFNYFESYVSCSFVTALFIRFFPTRVFNAFLIASVNFCFKSKHCWKWADLNVVTAFQENMVNMNAL